LRKGCTGGEHGAFTNASFYRNFSKRVDPSNPQTSEELKHSIQQIIANIDSEKRSRTKQRADACFQERSGHFQRLLQAAVYVLPNNNQKTPGLS
jgi:hypothetical protein